MIGEKKLFEIFIISKEKIFQDLLQEKYYKWPDFLPISA